MKTTNIFYRALCLVLMALCCVMASGQDLPGYKHPQGFLEDRNISVDHSTGIFRYRVPLYTLTSGDFKLPVSLTYTGRGVQPGMPYGKLGQNWTLDTGVMVTRTVRGGIPDEDIPYGFLNREDEDIPLASDATRVNTHERDGECDIFTAVFGTRSVNFILRKSNGDICAEPLEHTDVKIECERSGASYISGWVITDSDGTRYICRRTEWVSNLTLQDEVSFNGLANRRYVSSWYPTRIEPVNGEAVEFFYKGDENGHPQEEDRHVTNHIDSYRTRYEYGLPIHRPVHDYDTCREALENHLGNAYYYLQGYAEKLEVDDRMAQLQYESQFYQNGSYSSGMKDTLSFFMDMDWTKNPVHQSIAQEINLCHRVLGITANLTSLQNVTKELMDLLSSLSSLYESKDPAASGEFQAAHDALEGYINGNGMEYIQEKTVYSGISYKTVSPILTGIRCRDRIHFVYGIQDRLYGIEHRSDTGLLLSGCSLSHGSSGLSALTRYGSDSLSVATTSFRYNEIPESAKIMRDVYGYFKRYDDDIHAPFDTAPDEEYAKLFALNEVVLPDGGSVRMDYELNSYIQGNVEVPYGGIRIKSLILDDPIGNHTDTVSYSYGNATFAFLELPYNYKEENYGSFTDRIWHSSMKSRSNLILHSGNNGIHYGLVHEHISGRGSRSYLYNHSALVPEDNAFPYWLQGLPVYVVERNGSGTIVRLLQNIYYTGTGGGQIQAEHPECFVPMEEMTYGETIPQMMADEGYMDADAMAERMGIDLDSYPLGPDAQLFVSNILPRVRSNYSPLCYTLRYGGTTLIGEQREYRPIGAYTDHMQLLQEEVPYSRVAYHYDRVDSHTRPTRMTEYDSRGDSVCTHILYAGDMDMPGHGAFTDMQDANILSPAVKRAVVKDGNLLEETVTDYRTVRNGGRLFYEPCGTYTYAGNATGYLPDHTRLYNGNVSDYVMRTSVTGGVVGGNAFLPLEVTERGIRTSTVYDPYYKRPLLKALDLGASEAVAVDCHLYALSPYPGVTDVTARILELARLFQTDYHDRFDPQEIADSDYQDYRKTTRFASAERLFLLLGRASDSPLTSDQADETVELLEAAMSDAYGVEEFLGRHIQIKDGYYPMMGVPDPWTMTTDEMIELQTMLMDDLVQTGGGRLLRHFRGCSDGSSPAEHFHGPVSMSVPSGEMPQYRLYLVPSAASGSVNYTVAHSGGTAERTSQFSGATPSVLRASDLDLSGLSGITSVTVTGYTGVHYLAILPGNATFEATSYSPEGYPAVTFNRQCVVERNEYDNAGRPVRMRDRYGRLQEEHTYHTLNHE